MNVRSWLKNENKRKKSDANDTNANRMVTWRLHPPELSTQIQTIDHPYLPMTFFDCLKRQVNAFEHTRKNSITLVGNNL